jgi:pyruvate,water dikinase
MGDLAEYSPELGNKVKSLASLARLNLRTPRGFGIAYAVCEQHIEPLLPIFERIISEGGLYGDMSLRLTNEIIRQALGNSKEIFSALGAYIPNAEFYAIRSSCAPIVKGVMLVEDSMEASLAGQYESFLMVPYHKIPEAILHCFASLFSERCLTQFDVKNDHSYLHSRMSVLVQEMCRADLCGVVMTRDPIENSDSILGMEIAYGACEAIVSGQVQGDMHLCDRKSGNILSSDVGSKKWRISYESLEDFTRTNKVQVEVMQNERICCAASNELIQKIARLGMDIENHFGLPQDIELIVAGCDIIITQSRPITCINTKP